jgi:carbon-monoxide dehydrogenase large subunit
VSIIGTVTVASSVPAIGQGHETILAQIVADELGLSLDRVHVSHADTAATPYGTGCFASRGAIAGGGAAARAGRALAQKIRAVAAQLLECGADDVVLAGDAAHPAGVPARRIALAEIARAAHFLTAGTVPAGIEAGLEASAIYDPPAVTFANGCHVAVVRVDREVGTVTLLRYLVTHDCGRVVNPLLVDAQLHGAVAQGVASALSEQLVYDGAGQLLTGSLMDYPLPRADHLPDIEIAHLDNPSPTTEGGFKGVGESGIVGAPAAIANAIADAVPEIGHEICALPMTPERVWQWIAAATHRSSAIG